MRISSKGRYALMAAVYMAQRHQGGENITVMSMAQALDISKIYLEQVFSLLKRAGLVVSVKGARGGYQLARAPGQISALHVLAASDSALFEIARDRDAQKAQPIETVLRASVFDALDSSLKKTLQALTLDKLADEAEKYTGSEAMYYI